MAALAFAPGDQVVSLVGPGTVIDVRATPSGQWVYGIEDDDGAVTYFTGKALRPAPQ